MKEWKDDKDLFALIKEELYTAVVGDIMDKMGYTRQFLPPRIRPLRDDMLVAGRAMTVLEADVLDVGKKKGVNPVLKRSFGLMLEALDDLKEDEVYVCSGSSPAYALWGELMSARAIQCKAAGAVVNGYSRDTKGILALDFPCFSYGPYAQDQAPRGKVSTTVCRSKWRAYGSMTGISWLATSTAYVSCPVRSRMKYSPAPWRKPVANGWS